MRQIVLDTETTGLSPKMGHKVIEIGCVEIVNRQLTGNHFHHYINPQRAVDSGAFAVHGISTESLQDKPVFRTIMQDLIDYIADAELIIHNAPFDVGFLNHELRQAGESRTIKDIATVVDTLPFARKKHPGQPNSLDALCKRYNVNNAGRNLHGALLDSQLLASVYLAMTGGQKNLFVAKKSIGNDALITNSDNKAEDRPKLVVIKADATELALHNAYIDKITSES